MKRRLRLSGRPEAGRLFRAAALGGAFACLPAIAALAQQGSLPSSPQFMAVMTACGAGSSFKFEGDLRRTAESVYEKGRTDGRAVQDIVATIIERLPATDRVEAYRIYVDCIVQLSKDTGPQPTAPAAAMPASRTPQQAPSSGRSVRRISAYAREENLLCGEPGWRIGPTGVAREWELYQEDVMPSSSRKLRFVVGKPIDLKDGCVLVLSEISAGQVVRFDFIETTWK